MSYSISFLAPSQLQVPSERRSRPSLHQHRVAATPRQSSMESNASGSCHQSRLYLDKLSDQQRAIVKPLIARVENWKGHCLCSFGKPLLQAKVLVSRNQLGGESSLQPPVPRQYQVFLFSNILICCRKRTRPNARGQDWALKGRVFLRNIFDVQQIGETHLCISYHGDDGSDTFVIEFARPALLAKWAAVLEYSRERAAEPRSLEEAGSEDHIDIPPPAYYSPLPEYTSSSTPNLSAPLMERHSPLNTPLSTPPLYTPSDSSQQEFSFASPPVQLPCRPAMTSSLSASTMNTEANVQSDDYDTLEEDGPSLAFRNKLEEHINTLKSKNAWSVMAKDASVVLRFLLFAMLSIILSYLAISHRPASLKIDTPINMF